jgi:hypothetical protein
MHLGPTGVDIGIPVTYSLCILSRIGCRMMDMSGFTGPSHIPGSNKYLKSILTSGGKLVIHEGRWGGVYSNYWEEDKEIKLITYYKLHAHT